MRGGTLVINSQGYCRHPKLATGYQCPPPPTKCLRAGFTQGFTLVIVKIFVFRTRMACEVTKRDRDLRTEKLENT